MSFTLNVYLDKSIGTINLESLKTIVYHDDTPVNITHNIPNKIVNLFLVFLITTPPKVIYLSLNRINISLQDYNVNKKDTNISQNI